ncbi:MAG: hypothetical protein Q4G08_03265 [Capnocytophaga sp.]|nr:hypothetical protein [Capnocytophaga sp.]
MKKFLPILLAVTQVAYSQMINDANIPALNEQIQKRVQQYERSTTPVIASKPTAIADFFYLITDEPEAFLQAIGQAANSEELRTVLKGKITMICDLPISKTDYISYEGKPSVYLTTLLPEEHFNAQLYVEATEGNTVADARYIMQQSFWGGETTFRGFFLKTAFQQKPVPAKYADWIHYADIVIHPSTKVIQAKETKEVRYRTDPLVEYFRKKTNFPSVNEDTDTETANKRIDEWYQKRPHLLDSILKNDEKFAKLVQKEFRLAEKNNNPSDFLKEVAGKYIPKERILNLLRKQRVEGSCSFDSSPNEHLRKIARLSAEVGNWDVFIKAYLDYVNGNVERVAYSNIGDMAQQMPDDELSLLDVDKDKLYLGTLLSTDSPETHYHSDRVRMAKLYANNPSSHRFETEILGIIQNEEVDIANRLGMLHQLDLYAYFLKDSVHADQVRRQRSETIQTLPVIIRNSLLQKSKPIYDLYPDVKDELDKYIWNEDRFPRNYLPNMNFTAKEKNQPDIEYDLDLLVEKEFPDIKDFFAMQTIARQRIESHPYLKKIREANPDFKLKVEYYNSNKRKMRIFKEIPKELLQAINTEDAISIVMDKGGYKSRFILLADGHLLMKTMPKGFEMPGYTFVQLLPERKEYPGVTTYITNKMFTSEGEVTNPIKAKVIPQIPLREQKN